jgi:predicted amidohydrolase YtcJ
VTRPYGRALAAALPLAGSLLAGCARVAPEAPAAAPPAPGAVAPAAAPAAASADAPATTAVAWDDVWVVTLDPERPFANGLIVDGGRIVGMLSEEEGAAPAIPVASRVDLGGAVIVPGFVDHHLHLQGIGAKARQIDLVGTKSVAEVQAKVAEGAKSLAAGGATADAWIRGRGWDQNRWPEPRWPAAEVLDTVSAGHPVWLTRVDGHAAWLNTRALELAGITEETKDPTGGEIVRDAAGRPAGVLIDNALDLAATALPSPTPEEVRDDLRRALALLREAGVTGVHDMGTSLAALEQLHALEANGELSLRTFAWMADDASPLPPKDEEGLLRVVGVKLFADGALGSRGAALLQPYSDRPESSGLLIREPGDLTARAHALAAAGWRVCIHAIGDRGNRVALDALSAAGGAGHRIEHAQILDPTDIPRFSRSGIVASMQPTHATSDMPWAEARLGPGRLSGAYAWRTMLGAGSTLVFGSDAPVESHNPLWGVYAAVTRQDHAGRPAGGWLPEQRLGAAEALRAFSSGPLRVGGPADFTVLDEDPTAVPPAALLNLRVLRTVVEGRQVWP